MNQVGWILLLIVHLSIVSAQFTYTFLQPATGPNTVCVGSDVTLPCVVQRNVNSTTTIVDTVWSRNETTVGAGTFPNHMVVFNITIGVFTNLVITNVLLEDDNTEYNCTTANAPADFISSVVLNVTDRPGSLNVTVPESDITGGSFIVQWTLPTPAYSLPNTYTVMWYSNGTMIGSVITTGTATSSDNMLMYTVTGLSQNTNYSVTVMANNTCGAGPSSANQSVITNTKDPTAPPGTFSDDSNTGAIVGGVVGGIGGALLILLIIIIVVVVYLKKYRDDVNHSKLESGPTSPQPINDNKPKDKKKNPKMGKEKVQPAAQSGVQYAQIEVSSAGPTASSGRPDNTKVTYGEVKESKPLQYGHIVHDPDSSKKPIQGAPKVEYTTIVKD